MYTINWLILNKQIIDGRVTWLMMRHVWWTMIEVIDEWINHDECIIGDTWGLNSLCDLVEDKWWIPDVWIDKCINFKPIQLLIDE